MNTTDRRCTGTRTERSEEDQRQTARPGRGRYLTRFAATVALGALGAGCDATTEPAAPSAGASLVLPSDTQGPAATEMPVKMGDNGERWLPRRKIVNFAQAPSKPLKVREPVGKLATLNERAVADKLRPIMLGVDDVEYVLDVDDEQAMEAARQVIADMRSGAEVTADSAFGSGQRPQESPSVQVLNDGVFGGESRVNANAFAQNYPWDMIGSMANYNASPPGGEYCTVFKMINHYTAVTAAHCVYDSSGWIARRDLRFAAGSSTPRGVLPRNCYAMTVPSGWSSDVGDDEYDYAVIRLREGGSSGAWCNVADYDTGYFGYRGVSGCTTGVSGDMAGYPGKFGPGSPPPGAWVYPTLFDDYRTDGWTSCVTYPNHLWYYNDNSGGQSGAPFWTNYSGSYKVRAINFAIWTGAFDDSNAGRRIDQSVIDFMNKYKGY